MGRKLGGGSAPFLGRGQLGPIQHKVAWAEAYLHTKWHLDSYCHIAIWSQRIWAENCGRGLCPFRGGGAGSPSNTLWPGPRPTYTPSFILIHPSVWPQCTDVTDRTDKQDRTTVR